MARLALGAILLLAHAVPVAAQCIFANNEYVNPTATGCGDTLLQYTDGEAGDNQIPLGYPVPMPVDSVASFDGFRSYAALHAGQQDLMLLHTEVQGERIGSTHAGREIWGYRIGTPGNSTVYGQPKGAAMVIGAVHAREWQSPEALAEVFERALAMADDDDIGRYLLENLVLVLVPVLNIDGFIQTQRFPDLATADARQPRDGRMRRKNMHNPEFGGMVDEELATVPDNFFGVDLNRNHPFGFQGDPRNSNVHSLIYAGGSPQGEAESQALLAAAAMGPAARLRLYMDVHSFSQVYIAPQTGNATRDTLTRTLADRMRAVTGYKYRFSPTPQGALIGSTADYFAHQYQIPSWTLETEPLNGGQDYGGTGASHSGFITPDREIARLRQELADMAMLGFYHQAGPPSVVAAEIRDAEAAVIWSAQWAEDGAGARRLVAGADGALQAGGTYTLWLAFDKPMRWRSDGTVTQFAGQLVPLSPTISLEVAASGGTNRVIPLPADASSWLDGDHYHYRNDAFAVSFTLPSDLPSTATAAVLVVDTQDMTGQRLDANPATAVDWQGGGWHAYENTLGGSSLTGGADCTLKLWIGQVEGANGLVCNAAGQQPPPPSPPPASPRGGGGAVDLAWLLFVLIHPFMSRKPPLTAPFAPHRPRR